MFKNEAPLQDVGRIVFKNPSKYSKCPSFGNRPADDAPELSRGEGRIRATKGWISVDRGSKATLPLTMPRRVFKSSAKDSARRRSEIDLRGCRTRLIRRGGLSVGTGPSGRDAPTVGRVGTTGAGADC